MSRTFKAHFGFPAANCFGSPDAQQRTERVLVRQDKCPSLGKEND